MQSLISAKMKILEENQKIIKMGGRGMTGGDRNRCDFNYTFLYNLNFLTT